MTDPAIDLLRRLAGRVDDDALRGFRGYLGAGETTMMGDSLVGYLVRKSVSLTDVEHEILAGLVDADPDELAEIPRVDKISANFTFDAGKGAPHPRETDRRISSWLAQLPAARRLSRSYRRPVDATAGGQATWVYLVELSADGEVAAVQNQVPAGASNHAVVEVYQVGEALPPYHVEALRAARAVWSRHT